MDQAQIMAALKTGACAIISLLFIVGIFTFPTIFIPLIAYGVIAGGVGLFLWELYGAFLERERKKRK